MPGNQTSQDADQRDAAADVSDAEAQARDRAADARDDAMDRTDEEVARRDGARAVTGAEVVVRAAGLRRRSAGHRERSAALRMLAAGDRRAAAEDRAQAALGRRRARVDRDGLARRLDIAEADPLAGARTRVAGLHDLEREVDRCRRATGPLVVAYVGVAGLDDTGDGAGCGLVQYVVTLIRAHVRSYDLVVVVGDDELVCAMPGVTAADARERFAIIADALAAGPRSAAIRTGLAELTSIETATDLIARARANLFDRGCG